MFKSKPIVRLLIPDQDLETTMEKSANVVEVDGNDTNSHDNPQRRESKRKKREKSSRRMKGLKRAESVRKR